MTPSLEHRLRLVEDRLAIQDLIASYGPAVDTADADAVSRLWSDSGTYQFDTTVLTGSAIGELVELETHRRYLADGCAHILSAPRISITGDTAVAVNYSCVLVHADESWRADRVSANRWELVRTPAGWRVGSRTNRLLDGTTLPSDLLGPA